MSLDKLKWYRKGTGIKVAIPGDINEFGEQKIRPGIVIKSYPSHIKVQLLSTESNENDYYSIKINNKISYIRSIYYKTISRSEIKSFWYEKNKRIILDSKSVFFKKVAEMEYKEIINTSAESEYKINFLKEEEYDTDYEY